MPKPDLTPISRFPDLEKPGRSWISQVMRLLVLTTRGDILTRGASYVKRLALGTSGKVLHSDGTDVEWAVLQANEVEVEELSTATYDDVQDYINFFGDRTLLSGGTITSEGDGDAAMASCTAWCKVTDGDTAIGKFFDFAGVGNITLTDLVTNFIYLDYNGGTPQVVAATSITTHGFKQDHIFIAAVYRSGNTLHIHQTSNLGIAGVIRQHMHHLEEQPVHRASGMVTSSTGTRQLTITAGVGYAGLNRITTNAFDTSAAGVFSYWYYDGDAGPAVWVEVANATQISRTQYNDVATGLASLTSNRYGVHWVYMDNDGVHFHVVYGQGDYKASEAELVGVPASLPPIVTGYCVLIAKIICQEGTDTLTISYPWTEVFQTSLATDHGSLAGLGDDDHIQYLLADGSRDISGDLVPSSDGAIDLGNSTDGFAEIHVAPDYLIVEHSNTLAIRNSANTTNKANKVSDLWFSGSLKAAGDNRSINAYNADNNYLVLNARDNGNAVVEIARMQGAADPYMQFTLPVVFTPGSVPGTAVEGHFWYNAADDRFYYIDGAPATIGIMNVGDAPTAHKASHVDGTDDIQDATAAQKGVATAAQITKLDGIATGADVTGDNTCDTPGANHDILDGDIHQDSVADAVTRGSIISGNDTPKWDELVLGATGEVPQSDGDDLVYDKIDGSNLEATGFGASSERLVNHFIETITGIAFHTTGLGISAGPFAALINAGGTGGLTATNVPYDNESDEAMFTGMALTSPRYGRPVLHNIMVKESGTCTTDTTNKLIDGLATFQANNVAVGDEVKQTTDKLVGYVKSVDSETQLSIQDLDGNDYDLCPDGDEAYVVMHGIRYITAVNTATNVLTTASSTDDWADNDTLDTESPFTVMQGSTPSFELDLSEGTGVASTLIGADLSVVYQDKQGAGDANRYMGVMPYDTFDSGAVTYIYLLLANEITVLGLPIKINFQRIMLYYSTGNDSVRTTITIKGQYEYADT